LKPVLTRWLGWTAAFCLLGGCAGSTQSPESHPAASRGSAPTGELIDLHFAWPVGLTARVEYQETGESKTPQGVETIVFRSSHRMRVEQADEGIRVIHDEFSLEPVSSAEGAKSPGSSSSQDPLETEPDEPVGDLLPDLIVDRTGKLVRIAGIDRLRADALERMSKGTEPSPESRARLERWISHAVSDTALTERATRDWNALVSFWAGVRLAVGVTSASLAGGGAPGQISVTPRVACDVGDRAAKCVRIELESHPAPELRETILLVTEPDRLVPHEVRVGNEVHARMTRPDGKLENINQSRAWSYHFTYSSGS
jgi:hypothetical protein